MDRNDYYGGASASLNLEQLYEQVGELWCINDQHPDRKMFALG